MKDQEKSLAGRHRFNPAVLARCLEVRPPSGEVTSEAVAAPVAEAAMVAMVAMVRIFIEIFAFKANGVSIACLISTV